MGETGFKFVQVCFIAGTNDLGGTWERRTYPNLQGQSMVQITPGKLPEDNQRYGPVPWRGIPCIKRSRFYKFFKKKLKFRFTLTKNTH